MNRALKMGGGLSGGMSGGMRSLSVFEQSALGQPPRSSVIEKSVLPDVLSPAQQISRVFPFQSYFDSALLENALAVQRPNEPIVLSEEIQVPGYALGLHPSSQTPVAVEFRVNSQKSSSAPLILKPGQVIRPYGLPAGQRSGTFSGFRWGLPFGWLGGGLATLVAFSTNDSHVRWTEQTEVIFHRQRFVIEDPAAVVAPFSFNWPMRFPWPHALQGATPLPQEGSPSIGITPTRTNFVLRLDTLAASAVFRALWMASNDFGLNAAGAPITTEAVWDEVSWGIFAPTGIAAVSEFPVQERAGVFARLAADDGGVVIVSTDVVLQGEYVDVVRYGRL